MKSKFAKFVDATLGAALIFGAATAVLRYYTALSTAVFLALAVTACLLTVLRFKEKAGIGKARLVKNAEDMFFDFMFEPDYSPAKRLCKALSARRVNAVRHGAAVYAGKRAAFFAFDAPPTEKQSARMISKAKRYGATSAIVFGKAESASLVAIANFDVRYVGGNDTYRLFASLGALPDKRERKPHARLVDTYRHALAPDKSPRYAILAAAFFAIGIPLRSYITLACAAICCVLFVASLALAVAKKTKSTRKKISDR